MAASSEQPNLNTQQLLTTLLQATAQLVQSSSQQNQRLDELTDQVGRLAEGLTEIKLLAERQAETAERQEHTTARLVGIVETLIQQKTT